MNPDGIVLPLTPGCPVCAADMFVGCAFYSANARFAMPGDYGLCLQCLSWLQCVETVPFLLRPLSFPEIQQIPNPARSMLANLAQDKQMDRVALGFPMANPIYL